MVIALEELAGSLNHLLAVDRFQDYAPNGLQVEGRPLIRRLITGVTASSALIDAAIEAEADAIIVHHGYFWRGEPAPLVGVKGARVRKLMRYDISLLAYHLPLDAHVELGNNIGLARALGLADCSFWGKQNIAIHGRLSSPVMPDVLAGMLAKVLGRTPLQLPGSGQAIERVALCTGAAQGMLEEAAALGVQAYISGEVSEATTHLACESGLCYFAAGHHATERFGVMALADYIADRWGVEAHFVDRDNPV